MYTFFLAWDRWILLSQWCIIPAMEGVWPNHHLTDISCSPFPKCAPPDDGGPAPIRNAPARPLALATIHPPIKPVFLFPAGPDVCSGTPVSAYLHPAYTPPAFTIQGIHQPSPLLIHKPPPLPRRSSIRFCMPASSEPSSEPINSRWLFSANLFSLISSLLICIPHQQKEPGSYPLVTGTVSCDCPCNTCQYGFLIHQGLWCISLYYQSRSSFL